MRRKAKLEKKDVMAKSKTMKMKIDYSQCIKFNMEVKSHPNPSNGIFRPCPMLNNLERKKIDRIKRVTYRNLRVKKEDLKLRIVSELPKKKREVCGKKKNEKKKKKKNLRKVKKKRV